MKFMSILGRHILMTLLFLGPGEGTLELQPFDDEAEAVEIRTEPGTLIVLRADRLSHRHIPDGDDAVLSSWMLAPRSASSSSTQPVQTPVGVELEKYLQQKLQDTKARAASGE